MRVTWWCVLLLAVCPVVARSADAPSPEAPSPEARFAQRLESQVHLALPGRTATEAPFLCFSDVDIGDFSQAAKVDDDTLAFVLPCLDAATLARKHGIDAAKQVRYRALLVDTFRHSTPAMQALLSSPTLQRFTILVGTGINGSSAGLRMADGRLAIALTVNVAAFEGAPGSALPTFLSYYEAFQTLDGGDAHRAKTVMGAHRYAAMRGGPIVRLTLKDPKRDAVVAGPVGVLMAILHHELGHMVLGYGEPPALVTPAGKSHDADAWALAPLPASDRMDGLAVDADFPVAIFTRAPDDRGVMGYTFADPQLEAARLRLCFAQGPHCKRHAPGSAGYREDIVRVYSGTGIVDPVSTWKPDEAYCQWTAHRALERYVATWRMTPDPKTPGTQIDVLAQMRHFRRRALVERYMAYRERLFLASLAPLPRSGTQAGGNTGE